MDQPDIPSSSVVPPDQSLWQSSLQPFGCPACRQAYVLAPSQIGCLCPYCGKAKLESQSAYLRMESPEQIIPVQQPASAFTANIESWTKAVRLKPDGLRANSIANQARLVFWPVWLVDGDLSGSWHAELGFDYQVKSSQESYHIGNWQTREVIETRIRWEPRLGQIERHFNNVPVQALSGYSRLQKILGPAPEIKPLPYNAEQVQNAILHVPDLPPESAWSTAQTAIQQNAARDCLTASQAQHIRNFAMQAAYPNLNWTMRLSPYYISHYQDAEGNFQPVYINPLNGHVSGILRASQRKGWIWTGAGILVAMFLVLVGLVLLAGSVLVPPVAILAILVLIPAIFIGVVSPIPAIWAWQWNRQHTDLN